MDLTDRERAVLETIDADEPDLIALLQELIRAEPVNPPGKEERAAAIIRPILDELGFETEEYTEVEGRPNLVARLGSGDGDARSLFMTAHLDVVPVREPDAWPTDPFGGEIVDGRLYGRGACDHKSPIVAMLYAVKAMQEHDVELAGELTFVFDSNEERGGEHGMKYVVEQADIDGDMGIYAVTSSLSEESAAYFDTLGVDNVMRANFGNQVFRVTVEGELVHPMTPAETQSAGNRLSRLLPSIQAYCDGVRDYHDPLVGEPNAEITTIDSEGRPGRASEEIQVHVRRYYAPSEEPDEVHEAFETFVREAAREQGLGEHVSVELITDMPNIVVEADHPLVQSTTRAARLVRGREPTVSGVPAQTGITWLVKELGLPMVLFGFGHVNLHHAEPEWIEPGDVVDTTKAYALTYMDLLGAEA